MQNLQLPGSFIRNADIRTSESGAFLRIHITAEFTEDFMDKMGLQDPGESSRKTRMDCELPAGVFILTPDKEPLKNHEIQFSFSGASDFDIVTITKEKDGEETSKRREFRFTVHSEAQESADRVFGWLKNLKKSPGMLKLSYTGAQDPLGL